MGSIPWSRRSPGEGNGYPLQYSCLENLMDRGVWWAVGFPGGSDSKQPICSAGDLGSIPGLGKSPGEENGNSLQYSWLGNPMDRGAGQAMVHWVGHKELDTEQLTLTLKDSMTAGCNTEALSWMKAKFCHKQLPRRQGCHVGLRSGCTRRQDDSKLEISGQLVCDKQAGVCKVSQTFCELVSLNNFVGSGA